MAISDKLVLVFWFFLLILAIDMLKKLNNIRSIYKKTNNEEMPKGITIIPSNDLMEVAKEILDLVDVDQL